MDEPELLLYRRGCERLGWTPLSAEEFRPLHHRYRACQRHLHDWHEVRKDITPRGVWTLLQITSMHRRAVRDIVCLGFLGSAIGAGRSDGGPETGAVGALLPIVPSPRTRRTARPFPPEPA